MLVDTKLSIFLWLVALLALVVPIVWTRLRRTAEATAPDDAEA